MTEMLLRVTVVEASPWTHIVRAEDDDYYELDPGLSGAAAYLLEPAEPDSLHCKVCEEPVGLVSTVREDTYGNETEGVEWRFLTVVADNAKPRFDEAWVLCEDCTVAVSGG